MTLWQMMSSGRTALTEANAAYRCSLHCGFLGLPVNLYTGVVLLTRHCASAFVG